MGASLLEVKDRVQRYLSEIIGTVQIDKEGDYNFRQNSTHVFISVYELNETNFGVNVFAQTNFQVPPSPELFKYVATNNGYRFGRLCATEKDDGVLISFSHNLLGDFLDLEELRWAVGAVAVTADEIDDEIKNKFGGRLVYEE